MTYTITSHCIHCTALNIDARCRTLCPTGAIGGTDGKFSIDPNLCNDCVGYYGVPQCAAGCPTNGGCIPSSPSTPYWLSWFETYDCLVSQLKGTPKEELSYWESWFETYDRAIAQLKERKRNYWHRWFDTYAQKLQSMHSPAGV